MYLIVGLGNPGPRYKNTRHNIGFRVVERLAEKNKGRFKKKLFFDAKECRLEVKGKKVVAVEPLCFMNLSGKIVLRYKSRLKISPEKILIIYDDIDLPLGTIKTRTKGSSGGHNGMGSVIQSLGIDEIARLKVGINTGFKPADLSEYVLSDFEKDEITRAEEAIDDAVSECERWVSN
jgi:peptidyl-tRNA hydrolase, PTH1 family